MSVTERHSCTAFIGATRIATGDLTWVALAVKEALEADGMAQALVFDDRTSRVIEIDFRGGRDDVLRSIAARDLAEEAAFFEGPAFCIDRLINAEMGVFAADDAAHL